ncbi:UNVERIFIED_CONTAM: hypothetical protein NCL1_00715 [Trichonephila clavipes]
MRRRPQRGRSWHHRPWHLQGFLEPFGPVGGLWRVDLRHPAAQTSGRCHTGCNRRAARHLVEKSADPRVAFGRPVVGAGAAFRGARAEGLQLCRRHHRAAQLYRPDTCAGALYRRLHRGNRACRDHGHLARAVRGGGSSGPAPRPHHAAGDPATGAAGHHPAPDQPIPEPDQEHLAGHRRVLHGPAWHVGWHHAEPDRERTGMHAADDGHLSDDQPHHLVLHEYLQPGHAAAGSPASGTEGYRPLDARESVLGSDELGPDAARSAGGGLACTACPALADAFGLERQFAERMPPDHSGPLGRRCHRGLLGHGARALASVSLWLLSAGHVLAAEPRAASAVRGTGAGAVFQPSAQDAVDHGALSGNGFLAAVGRHDLGAGGGHDGLRGALAGLHGPATAPWCSGLGRGRRCGRCRLVDGPASPDDRRAAKPCSAAHPCR